MLKIVFTVLLNIFIIGLVGIFIYLGLQLYTAYKDDSASLSALINPSYLLSKISFASGDEWKKFDGTVVSFEYPANWQPEAPRLLSVEGVVVDLKIPIFLSLTKIGSKDLMRFNQAAPEKRRPENLISEQEFVIGGRKGLKWIYKNKETYYYEYIVPLRSYSFANKQVSSFSLVVESGTRDNKLEKKLDHVASSLIFKFDGE